MQITVKITSPVSPPPVGNIWFLEHEWPVRGIIAAAEKVIVVDGKEMNTLPSAPETCKTLDDHWENLTEAREWWWFNMFNFNAPAVWTIGFIKKKWIGYTDSSTAWTNGHGSDIYRSFVCASNIGKGPMGQETLICKGNPVRVIGAPQVIGGENWHPIEAVNSSLPLPSWQSVLADPCLCHKAVILYPDGHTSNFPQLGGEPVPLPVVSKTGILWVKEWDNIGGVRQRVLRKLAPGEAIPPPIRGPRTTTAPIVAVSSTATHYSST